MTDFYPATALTGGGSGALDAINGANLADKDAAVVITPSHIYHYSLDATSGQAESSPDTITPDTNAGTKRWILVDLPPGRSLGTMTSVKEWGAKGDGSTDDTTAIQNALTDVIADGLSLYFPEGTYMVNSLSVPAQSHHLNLFGIGPGQTVIKKRTNDGAPLLTVGGVTGNTSEYTSFFAATGITFYGYGDTATDCHAFKGIRLLNPSFRQCHFVNADIGFLAEGTYGASWVSCYFGRWGDGNDQGMRLTQSSDGMNCNINSITHSFINNNVTGGILFTHGRLLNITDSWIENNSNGGVYVQSTVGGSSGEQGINLGVILKRCWVESCGGTGAIRFESAFNIVKACDVVNNAGATHDIYINGGNYIIDGVKFGTSKSYNIKEDTGTLDKNIVMNVNVDTNYSLDWDKTALLDYHRYHGREIYVNNWRAGHNSPTEMNIYSPDGTAAMNISNTGVLTDKDGVSLSYSKPEYARISKSTDQTISNSTFTAITFDTEDADTNGSIVDLANNQFVLPTGAIGFKANASIDWQSGSTGQRIISIQKNGSGVTMDRYNPIFGSERTVSSGFIPASSGDTVSLVVQHSDGGSLDVLSTAYTFLAIEVIYE